MAAAWAATAAFAPAPAAALSPGFGKGVGYCSEHGNHASRYSFEDVYACSTISSFGPTPFDSAGSRSFQCVELSARFLWAIYGIWAGPGSGVQDGADFVAVVHRLDPRLAIGFPGPRSVPVAGDIISLGPGGAVDGRFGHTAVVTSAHPRTGWFTIVSQNLPPGFAGQQAARVGLGGRHNGRVLLKGVWTTASWLELRHRPVHPRGR
jgi:hypothetical protein